MEKTVADNEVFRDQLAASSTADLVDDLRRWAGRGWGRDYEFRSLLTVVADRLEAAEAEAAEAERRWYAFLTLGTKATSNAE